MTSSRCLEMTGISKSFGGVAALRDARLSVRSGEIHGLIGENGAGKSTLINIASGVLQPDSGTIRLEDSELHLGGPRDAAEAGIAVVHQESDLFAQLSLAENMLLGEGLVRNCAGLVRWGKVNEEAKRRIGLMGERFDTRESAGGLPVARRMMAEIATAISQRARVLFLDEPTASLTLQEIHRLFERLRELRDKGVALIYVSHRLEEVLELCDRVTVMRDGETVETRDNSDLSMDALVGAMVGRQATSIYSKQAVPLGETRLRVENLTDAADAFRDVSFDVGRGEILGVYGFVGAGRSEMAQALFGLRPLRSGAVALDGQSARVTSPAEAVRRGLAYLPEDRLVQSLFRGHSLRRNATIPMLRRLSRAGLIQSRQEDGLVLRIMQTMKVRAESSEQPIVTLSGGNQQKVVFGRWQATDPAVLILDEPTRGVDVGAKGEIHKLICESAENGAAVVMISSDLPEIMAMSDRVLTFSEGRTTGVFDPKKDREETVAAAAVPRTPAEIAVAGPRIGWPHRLLHFREAGLLAFILVLGLGMAVAKPTEFATAENLLGVLSYAALPAIMAMGAMLVICAGGIDISVGSMMGLVGAIAGMAANNGVHPLLCLGLALGLGAVLGMLNGGTALLARVHPIIVTLAGISIYRGLMRIATGQKEVLYLPDGYRALADGRLLGIPRVCWYIIAVTFAAHVFLRYTLLGRRILALGNSESAARLIGLSKTRLTLFVFGVSGALVGLCGVLFGGFYGKVQMNTGEGWELQAIAATVIGGTNIMGGRGSALGTLLGAFLVALVRNMLILGKANAFWQQVVVGGLILAAVLLDAGLQRLRRTRA